MSEGETEKKEAETVTKVKCPKCGSKKLDIGEYTEHIAYDSVVDAINASSPKYEGFSVWATCEDCGCDLQINFEITGVEARE